MSIIEQQYIKNPLVKSFEQTSQPKTNKTSKNPIKTEGSNMSLAFAGKDAIGRAGILLQSKESNKTLKNEATDTLSQVTPTSDYKKEVLARSKDIAKEAEVIHDRSDEVKKEAYAALSDAQNLVKNTAAKIESNPKSLARKNSFFRETQGDKTIKAFYKIENGKAVIQSINIDKANGLKDRIYLDWNHAVQTVVRNIRILEDKSEEIGERYWFYDGKLCSFESGKYTNGTKKKTNEAFEYVNGRLDRYNANFEILPDNTHKYGKIFRYGSNGKLREYSVNMELLHDGTHRADETFEYWDDILEYTADKKLLPKTENGANFKFRFKGDKLINNSKP